MRCDARIDPVERFARTIRRKEMPNPAPNNEGDDIQSLRVAKQEIMSGDTKGQVFLVLSPGAAGAFLSVLSVMVSCETT